MTLPWIQQAVRLMQNTQNELAASTVIYTPNDGSGPYTVPARLDVVTGETQSYDGITVQYQQWTFKISTSKLPATPERGDRIELIRYDERGVKTDSWFFRVAADQGVSVYEYTGNFGDTYRIKANKGPS